MTPPYDEEEISGDPLANFGMPLVYQQQTSALQMQETQAEQSAMEYLRASLNKSAEVTPMQGLATALLAAVPTLGGYLIGKSVGKPQIDMSVPEGTNLTPAQLSSINRQYDPSQYQTGAMAGGLAGTKIGMESAGGFLKGLDAEQERKNAIYEKMAALESGKASRLQGMESNLLSAGLAAGQRRADALDPELQAAEVEQARQIADAQYSARSKYLPAGQGDEIFITEEMAAKLGNPNLAGQTMSSRAINSINNVQAEDRREDAWNTKKTGGIPLTVNAKVTEKLGAADNAFAAQERLRELYNTAVQQIGPGFVQAFARQGLAALPANAQQEFIGYLNGLAMELNRAVDPTPSDAGKMAQLQKLQASIENGNFLQQLDFEVKNARRAALAAVKPFTIGLGPDATANKIADSYAKDWGLNPDGTSPGVNTPAPGGMPNRQDYKTPQEYLNALRAYNASR